MILCCGEALIDMLPRQTATGESCFAPHAGGAVFNTAIALGRLGQDVGFLCGLSTDLFGERLAETLRDSGVSVDLCPRLDAPTTLAFVTLVDGQARYAFYDENTALRRLAPEILPEIGPQVQALFFGGISLVSEPCGSAYEALCLRERDRLIMLDPNIRPGFIKDEAAYRARLARMMAVADVVKLSDEDLRWLMPGMDESAAIARLRAVGVSLVLITRGGDGATGHWEGESVSVAARRVEVVDTVGAGDTFNAGFLAHLSGQGKATKAGLATLGLDDLRAAMTHAAKVAAITASRAGANPPWAREL
jgi:fructokinase